MKLRLLLLMLVVLPLAACRRGTIEVQRNGNGTANVTVTVTEAEVNAAITDALNVSNPLLRDPTVDLQPGQIVISGEHDRRDGNGRVSGSVTMTLTVQDGALLAQIVSADIEGLDMSDARIAEFNQRMTERMTARAGRDNRAVDMQSVTITDSDVQIVFMAGRGQ